MGERCAGGVKLKLGKRCPVCDAGPGDQCAKAALRDWEELQALRNAAKQACDLLAERTYGSPARSPSHNARLVLEGALALSPATGNDVGSPT
jgi:hypothetical protein